MKRALIIAALLMLIPGCKKEDEYRREQAEAQEQRDNIGEMRLVAHDTRSWPEVLIYEDTKTKCRFAVVRSGQGIHSTLLGCPEKK